MDLCPLHIIFLFFIPEQAQRVAFAERSAFYDLILLVLRSQIFEYLRETFFVGVPWGT